MRDKRIYYVGKRKIIIIKYYIIVIILALCAPPFSIFHLLPWFNPSPSLPSSSSLPSFSHLPSDTRVASRQSSSVGLSLLVAPQTKRNPSNPSSLSQSFLHHFVSCFCSSSCSPSSSIHVRHSLGESAAACCRPCRFCPKPVRKLCVLFKFSSRLSLSS